MRDPFKFCANFKLPLPSLSLFRGYLCVPVLSTYYQFHIRSFPILPDFDTVYSGVLISIRVEEPVNPGRQCCSGGVTNNPPFPKIPMPGLLLLVCVFYRRRRTLPTTVEYFINFSKWVAICNSTTLMSTYSTYPQRYSLCLSGILLLVHSKQQPKTRAFVKVSKVWNLVHVFFNIPKGMQCTFSPQSRCSNLTQNHIYWSPKYIWRGSLHPPTFT